MLWLALYSWHFHISADDYISFMPRKECSTNAGATLRCLLFAKIDERLCKKRLGRQIVHKYACWRLRLFLCKITDAVFRIIEMKEMGLTFVQPLASSNTNILPAWNVFRMFKRCFLLSGIKWQCVDISGASDI